MQGFGQRDWPVPQTCCILTNLHELQSHLDPKPMNLTQCQSLQKHEYSKARHTDGCLEYLDEWYREHYILFLGASLIVAVIEFSVLLSIILSCTKLAKVTRHRINQRTTGTTMRTNVMGGVVTTKRRQAPQPQAIQQNENIIYMTSAASDQSMMQVQEFDKSNYANVMKMANTSNYPYHVSKSYLV